MKNILLFCFAILLTMSLQAQTFTNYTADEGLISNSVNCLSIDSNDKVWFGTTRGISSLDGNSWTSYDVTSHPSLLDNNITALAVDSDNNLWIGTDFGLNKFDGSNWTSYTDADGLADNRVKYIAQGPDGKMWIANNDGISILDGTSWKSFVMADGLPFGGTNFVAFDSNGMAYLGTPLGGVVITDGNTLSLLTENEGLLSNKIRSIAITPDNQKWVGTADGITVLDANDAFVIDHEFIFVLPPPDKLNPVEDVQIDPSGRVWVGVYVDYLVTEGGVSLYDGSDWSDFDVDDGLVGPVVRRLAIDSDNNVWVATSTGVTKIGDLSNAAFDVEVDRSIQLFPNPTSSLVHLRVPHELLGSAYQLYNSLGMLVREGRIQNEQTQFDLNSLADGYYFLSVDRTYSRKVLVNRK